MAGKRALDFPRWAEAAVIALLVVMAGVEYLHDQWAWAAIFGVAGAVFGANLVVRVITGEKNGRK